VYHVQVGLRFEFYVLQFEMKRVNNVALNILTTRLCWVKTTAF
jgi:hypothetical protein